MASELKHCGGCGATSERERCIGCLHDFGTQESAWVSTRPAPAATDTGLVTVGYVTPEWLAKHCVSHTIIAKPSPAWSEAVVTRSQAEELLAAERAKVRHWQEQYTEMHSQFIDLAKSAEADNAAQAAQIKELTGDRDSWRRVAEKLAGEKQALEAKLAAATDLISRAKEIIPDSYINWHDFARAALGGKP